MQVRNMVLVACVVAVAEAGCTQSSNPSYYQQAAALYDQSAAQCSEPGATCMRRYAAYMRCEAAQYSGGGTCGASPTCSTACSPSGSGSAGVSNSATAPGLTQKQQLAMTGLSLALNWLSNRHHNDNGAQVAADNSADEAQREADEARAQAAIAEANAAFSNQVNLRNALTSGADPSTLGNGPGQSQEDPTVALRNQLTSGDGSTGLQDQQVASNNSGDSSDPTAALRAQFTAQANVPVQSSLAQEESETISPDPQALQTAMTPPPNSPLSSSYSNSSDDPNSTQPTALSGVMNSISDTVSNAAGNATAKIQDGYESVMSDLSSLKQIASSLWNDPSVQFLNQVRTGDYTTAPSITTSDSPDQAADKAFSQAILGFGDLKDGLFKGLNDYGTKMVNKMGEYLDLANVQFFGGQSQ